MHIIAIAVLAVVPLNAAEEELKHTKDSLDKVKELVEEKKAILLDVREKREWNAGHIKGAKLVPWSKLRFHSKTKRYKGLPENKVIYTYCKAGFRALNAAKKLKAMGYEVKAIKAGFDELVENGFESEK